MPGGSDLFKPLCPRRTESQQCIHPSVPPGSTKAAPNSSASRSKTQSERRKRTKAARKSWSSCSSGSRRRPTDRRAADLARRKLGELRQWERQGASGEPAPRHWPAARRASLPGGCGCATPGAGATNPEAVAGVSPPPPGCPKMTPSKSSLPSLPRGSQGVARQVRRETREAYAGVARNEPSATATPKYFQNIVATKPTN